MRDMPTVKGRVGLRNEARGRVNHSKAEVVRKKTRKKKGRGAGLGKQTSAGQRAKKPGGKKYLNSKTQTEGQGKRGAKFSSP